MVLIRSQSEEGFSLMRAWGNPQTQHAPALPSLSPCTKPIIPHQAICVRSLQHYFSKLLQQSIPSFLLFTSKLSQFKIILQFLASVTLHRSLKCFSLDVLEYAGPRDISCGFTMLTSGSSETHYHPDERIFPLLPTMHPWKGRGGHAFRGSCEAGRISFSLTC